LTDAPFGRLFRKDLCALVPDQLTMADVLALLDQPSPSQLEAAYGENQEVQSDLALIRARGLDVPASVARQADRLGGIIYGLLRAEMRARGR
jgi:hypothetical protein